VKTRRLVAGFVLGLGYLLNGVGVELTGAQEPDATIVLVGTLRDTAGQVVAEREIKVMLLEYVAPKKVRPGSTQLATVLDGTTTDSAGAFSLGVTVGDIPAGYVAPDGRVIARLIAPDPSSAVHQVADFNIYGEPDPRGTERSAPLASATPVAHTLTVDAIAHETETSTVVGGAPADDGVQAAAINPYNYCDVSYEYYAWEETGLGALPWASDQKVFTKGLTAQILGAYNGVEHKHNTVVSVGGGFFDGGLSSSTITSADIVHTVPQNSSYDLQSQWDYNHRQLACYETATGRKRYAGVGEYYPWRPTGSTRFVSASGQDFACNHTSTNPANTDITLSRGRTRNTSGSFSISGVAGKVGLGLSTSSSTTSTIINRLTVDGKGTAAQTMTLCGSDDVPIYATLVREK
jgi:hypothetical protein